MKPLMTVVITKKHTKGADYMDNYDCPLARAIKEQYPEFPLYHVLGHSLDDVTGRKYYFNLPHWQNVAYSYRDGWGIDMMDRINVGKIKSFTVKIYESYEKEVSSDVER